MKSLQPTRDDALRLDDETFDAQFIAPYIEPGIYTRPLLLRVRSKRELAELEQLLVDLIGVVATTGNPTIADWLKPVALDLHRARERYLWAHMPPNRTTRQAEYFREQEAA